MISSISPDDIAASLILKTIHNGSDKNTVFLPNFGDFGPVIHKLIKIVHFFQAPKKIVCCKKGDEALFPSADDFYYDWDDFIPEKHKWGFFSKYRITGVGKTRSYTAYKIKYWEETQKIMSFFGSDCTYIHLWQFAPQGSGDYVFEKYDHLFKFKLSPRTINNLKVDVVINPRNRESRKENNFLYWEYVIEEMNSKGYSVGCIGSKEESFVLKNSAVNSWDFEDRSSACIEMLSNCKLYIGLDTGASHLAAFMSVPMIIFSHANPDLYCSNFMERITENYFLDLGKHVQDNSLIVSSALSYLEKHNAQS